MVLIAKSFSLFLPAYEKIRQKERFFRIHPSDRRTRVGRGHDPASVRDQELARLDVIAPLFPPRADPIACLAGHAVGDRESEIRSNDCGVFLRIDGSGDDAHAEV
jgi:hypothetical protein